MNEDNIQTLLEKFQAELLKATKIPRSRFDYDTTKEASLILNKLLADDELFAEFNRQLRAHKIAKIKNGR